MTTSIIPTPRNGRHPFGLWLHGLQQDADRDAMRRTIERMVSQGVDILFACIKQTSGEVDYPSAIARQSAWSQGMDPLQTLTEVAKEFSLKVHAWFCVFPEGEHSRLLNAHPELQAIQNHPHRGLLNTPDKWGTNMRWSCTNRSEVQAYQESLIAEVIARYPVEGIHFDWIRSGFYQCACAYCQDQCRTLTGADLLTEMGPFHPQAQLWYDYRADNITRFVGRVADRAHTAGMETSAAVFCAFPLSYNEQAQDWPRWLKDGALDLAIPMTYTMIPAEMHYYTLGQLAMLRDAGRGELWQGISCMRLQDGQRVGILAQAAIDAGAPGLVVFHYPEMTDANFAAVRAALRSSAIA